MADVLNEFAQQEKESRIVNGGKLRGVNLPAKGETGKEGDR